MANESERLVTSNTGAVDAQEVLNTAFSKLKELGTGEESLHLFPLGIGSVDVEVESSDEPNGRFHLALRISAIPPVPIAPADATTLEISAEDDAEISFNTEGHRVIALIAKLDLMERRPAVWARVQQILTAGDRELTEAAIFPDVIRNSQPETKPFHFIDIPFRDDGPVNPELPAAPHVISKIQEFSDFFRNGGGDEQENVDALSWLIHMFGDIHQPLHCIEHISSLHPGGDRGGNSFKLRGKAKNLHSAWDSSVNVSGPRDEEELAPEIAQQHTRETLAADLQINDPVKWARASFRLAKKYAYSITENPADPPTLTATYRKNMEKVGRRQAALGGYRLADRLEALL